MALLVFAERWFLDCLIICPFIDSRLNKDTLNLDS